jgi:hypothetical protein
MVTRGILERNELGKIGRKIQARQCQNNEVVDKGDRLINRMTSEPILPARTADQYLAR